ncbi:c-di-GMP-related signal transduction protein [Hydrogenivirga caldilitoris]|uniref:C-di-GMP-related signal transduction protein n=1 Tax=Hydrogenivirga caldilitoris TaxID=246264 RepID=A0A497XPL8_9AQUI|nr:HDOD domain-containing protein [Hydrogenivirga caldilitoris]RLJ70895.1 c-di-GMP-related signal transduction protein [Hydrogenivirga caldilitoris]
MEVKLSSFIFKRQNIRDSAGDISFYKVWIDKWEEEREPVDVNSLILHLVANYSPEVEEKLLGSRRGLVDIPVDMLVSKSVIDVLNGTKFILNLTLPRKALTSKHLNALKELFGYYQDNGFLFSIHKRLLSSNREVFNTFSEYITYVYSEDEPVHLEGKLTIGCSESLDVEGFDFFCEGEYEDVLIINSLKHMQGAVSRLISMLSEEASVDSLTQTIKGDPALVTKLLQYVNSPLFPHRKEIESIKNAINYLGLENLKKFLIAVWMSQFFGQDPSFIEFIRKMLSNAFLLESFSKNLQGIPKDELFFVGLFYKMPSAFGVRPEVFFNSMQLPEEIKNLYGDKRLEPYLKLIDLMDGGEVYEFAKTLGIDKEELEEHINYAQESVKTFLA